MSVQSRPLLVTLSEAPAELAVLQNHRSSRRGSQLRLFEMAVCGAQNTRLPLLGRREMLECNEEDGAQRACYYYSWIPWGGCSSSGVRARSKIGVAVVDWCTNVSDKCECTMASNPLAKRAQDLAVRACQRLLPREDWQSQLHTATFGGSALLATF